MDCGLWMDMGRTLPYLYTGVSFSYEYLPWYEYRVRPRYL